MYMLVIQLENGNSKQKKILFPILQFSSTYLLTFYFVILGNLPMKFWLFCYKNDYFNAIFQVRDHRSRKLLHTNKKLKKIKTKIYNRKSETI